MRKRLRAIWLIVFLLLTWVAGGLHAAELKIEKTLTKEDGLASDTVLAIFEDSHGNMWFGTTDGITRYDGARFQTFTTENGLASNIVGLIFEDRQGMLWFGDGVLSSVLKRGKPIDMSWMKTPLSELANMPHDQTSQGATNAIPLKGMSRYDGHEFRIFTTADGLAASTVKDIFEDQAGTLWFATGAGVSRYNGEKFDTLNLNGPMGMEVLPDWWAVAFGHFSQGWGVSENGTILHNPDGGAFGHGNALPPAKT